MGICREVIKKGLTERGRFTVTAAVKHIPSKDGSPLFPIIYQDLFSMLYPLSMLCTLLIRKASARIPWQVLSQQNTGWDDIRMGAH